MAKLLKEDFLIGINYLKNYYTSNLLDTNNKEMLNVWYMEFENLDKNVFFAIIREYATKEDYAPRNPNQLLKYCKYKTGEEVWQWLKRLNDQYPYDSEYYKNKFFQELNEDLIAYDIFKEMISSSEKNIFVEENDLALEEIIPNFKVVGFGYEYRKNYFIKNYDSKSKKGVKQILLEQKEKQKMLIE